MTARATLPGSAGHPDEPDTRALAVALAQARSVHEQAAAMLSMGVPDADWCATMVRVHDLMAQEITAVLNVLNDRSA